MRIRTSGGTAASPGLTLAIGCALAAPVSLAGQECVVDREHDHTAWHDAERARASLEDRLAGLLTSAGQAALGSLVIRPGRDRGPEVERVMVSVPGEVEDEFDSAIAEAVPALGQADEVRIDFGAPRPELWADRTERCEPELDNVAEAGGLLAQVMAGAIQREGKARPAGRVRLDFWVLVDWTGRVSAIEFREDQGTWNWLIPYLEAMGPALRYRPATLNGAVRTAWVPQQFELEF